MLRASLRKWLGCSGFCWCGGRRFDGNFRRRWRHARIRHRRDFGFSRKRCNEFLKTTAWKNDRISDEDRARHRLRDRINLSLACVRIHREVLEHLNRLLLHDDLSDRVHTAAEAIARNKERVVLVHHKNLCLRVALDFQPATHGLADIAHRAAEHDNGASARVKIDHFHADFRVNTADRRSERAVDIPSPIGVVLRASWMLAAAEQRECSAGTRNSKSHQDHSRDHKGSRATLRRHKTHNARSKSERCESSYLSQTEAMRTKGNGLRRVRSHTLRLLLLAAVGLGSAAAALGGADGAWSRSSRLHGRAATRLGCTAARFGAHCAWSSRRHGRAAISGLGCAALGLVRTNGAWGGRGGAAASEESDEGESGERSDGLHGQFLNVLSASADGVVFADTAKILSSLFEPPHSGSACSTTEIKFLGGDGIGQPAPST